MDLLVANYPFKTEFPQPARSLIQRLSSRYETWRITRRERRHDRPIPLTPLSDIEDLADADLPLVFITRNEMTILPSFLKYYRTLGVTRFICVDDGSTDGAREYLLGQRDVDVWKSSLRFGEARRGRRWRESLFRIYGYDRWYVNVDTDEFLVYDGCPEETIRDLISILQENGIRRLPAPMLDFYPAVDTTHEPETMPWKTIRHFDASGYTMQLDKRGISIKGGPRKRLFGEENELIKYPVIYWDKDCMFGSSIHRPLPYQDNFSFLWGAILHFKFFTNYRDKVEEAASDQQHFNASQHYHAMKSEIDKFGSLSFVDNEHSIEFSDADQLVRLGFMSEIRYD